MYKDGPGEAERHAGPCHTWADRCPNWENFPTEPPVRGRNDGFSPGVPGITVSKHRNESIKAYGNAVVPQVVLQIFKAIEEYETNTYLPHQV
jgi:DNA (cytosine-5)-methyltransferase 1